MSRYYTGKKIVIEEDTNPNSPTFGQTRTTIEESSDCDFKPNMTLLSSSDDVEVWEDINPYSPLFGTRIEIIEQASDPMTFVYKSECLQTLYNEVAYGNSGYLKRYLFDINPYSSTYQEESEETIEDQDICTLPNMEQILENTYTCELIEYPPLSKLGPSGTKLIYSYDINPYSQTYNQLISTDSVEDPVLCKIPNTEPNIKVHCSLCELQDGERTGNLITYYQDLNVFSPTYTGENEYLSRTEPSRSCSYAPVPPPPADVYNIIYFNAEFEGEPYINVWDGTSSVNVVRRSDFIEPSDLPRYQYKAVIREQGLLPTFYQINVVDINFSHFKISDTYGRECHPRDLIDSRNTDQRAEEIRYRVHTLENIKSIVGVNIEYEYLPYPLASGIAYAFSNLPNLEEFSFGEVEYPDTDAILPLNIEGLFSITVGFSIIDKLKTVDISPLWRFFKDDTSRYRSFVDLTKFVIERRDIENLIIDDIYFGEIYGPLPSGYGVSAFLGTESNSYPDKPLNVYHRRVNNTETYFANSWPFNTAWYYSLYFNQYLRDGNYIKLFNQLEDGTVEVEEYKWE